MKRKLTRSEMYEQATGVKDVYEKRKLTIDEAIKNITDALLESGEEFIAEIYMQTTGVKAAYEEANVITVWGLTDQEIQEIGEKTKFEETRP